MAGQKPATVYFLSKTMPVCLSAKTTKNILKPCDPPVSGVRSIFYIGFLSQLTASPRAVGDKKTITALTLKAGEKLTKIEGYKLSNDFGTGFNATTYANFTPHTGSFAVFDQSSSGLAQIDILKDVEDMFIICKQNGAGGNWRALGINAGMKCTGSGMKFNDENGGATVMTFQAAQEVVQPEILTHITATLVDTDEYLAGLAFTDV